MQRLLARAASVDEMRYQATDTFRLRAVSRQRNSGIPNPTEQVR
jgi:hypothetical protein